ncbi:MAG: CHASE2 domain-containing protein [Deltaproteobacteria bacterium]|nr:CHASE2 domain-containing protein [Deltaproteobacteria bacterium]
MCIWPPSLATFLEGKVYDSLMRSAPRGAVAGSVTIVDLDEASLERLGQWPWPRYRVARLLGKIRKAGAVGVGLDMVFAEPDRTSLSLLSGEIARDLGIRMELAGLPAEALNTDRALAMSLAGSFAVLGYQFDFDAARGETCVLHPLRAAVRAEGGRDGTEALFDAPGVVCNLPILAEAAGSSGFFNVTPDPDGVLRRVPMVIRHKGVLYPSLALALYLRARGDDAVLETGPEGVEALRLGERSIPLDRRGNLLVNYRGRHHTFPHVSAAAVLGGSADPALLKGKIVLIGATAAGLKEIRTTPLDAAQPGVEIHATVLDNLLSGDPIAVPRWARGLQVSLVLLPGLMLTALIARGRAVRGLAAIIPCIAGIPAASYWLLAHRQAFLPPLMPVATLAIVFTVLTSIRFLQADREVRERTRMLALTQDAIIQSLAALTETRHHETGGHIQRTRHYMRVLAMRLKEHPRFRHSLDDDAVDLLFRLAPLHDIGKVGVRDRILLNPAPLTPEEYEEMKRHTVYGSETIRQAKNLFGENTFLQIADEIVLNHHERWDGTGYPRGLRGDEIPIPGRLMAIADAYDAIISERLYKPALPHEEAVRSMSEKRGTSFDPDALDAFLDLREEFRRIASRFAGAGTEPEPPTGA